MNQRRDDRFCMAKTTNSPLINQTGHSIWNTEDLGEFFIEIRAQLYPGVNSKPKFQVVNPFTDRHVGN